MSLELDKRQRAMLREMGVRVWLPETPVAAVPVALKVMAPEVDLVKAKADFSEYSPVVKAVAPPVTARQTDPSVRTAPPQAAPVHPPLPARARADSGLPSWRLGEAQLLYAQTAPAEGARWLVLAETPAAALQGPVFQGDAGKLLDNMLRAARLHLAGAVLFAPVVRHAAVPPSEEFSAALAALISHARPDIVLVMGRLASQALLQSTEPLGKLRGRVHPLHGASAVVTYDATYLLRSWADKAKAWEDLCLAMSLVTAS